MKWFFLVLKVIVLFLFIALAANNTHSVAFNWLPGNSLQWPLIVVLLVFFVSGCLFGMVAMLGRLLSLRHENNRLRSEVRRNAQAVLPAAHPSNDQPA